MECNTFEELLYSDLLIADSMEKNNLKDFPLRSARRSCRSFSHSKPMDCFTISTIA